MTDFSLGFKGFLQAEDIHGQIRLCKADNKNMLHLDNMNFNYACKYDDSQAKEVKKLLDREGVRALSLYVRNDVSPERARALADIYGVEYLVVDSDEKKRELESLITDKQIITDGREPHI